MNIGAHVSNARAWYSIGFRQRDAIRLHHGGDAGHAQVHAVRQYGGVNRSSAE